MSRVCIHFGDEISTTVRARISYAFRVFAAIYGHEVDDQQISSQTLQVCYGKSRLADKLPEAIYLPARYFPRPPSQPAPHSSPYKYAGERFDLFYGRDELGRPDWLGEIFEWLSSADEMSITERDENGRIPYAHSIFARQGLSPRRPHALAAMAWLQNYFENGNSAERLPKAPSPDKRTDHFIIPSHDLDIYWSPSWRWHDVVTRQVKNLIISQLESRDFSSFRANLARVSRALLGRPVDDFLPALLEAADLRGFRSTLFVIARSAHRRDANYQIEELVERLREAANKGFDSDLHGSYTSIVEKCDLLSEAQRLAKNAGRPPQGSRQHWLRFDEHEKLFQAVENAGLLYDSTLGFSDQVGFRNGACFAFPPYDFARESPYDFLEIPLAIMDRALVPASKRNGKTCAALADEVVQESRRLGWGGISLLWHNPMEDVYVGREVNRLLWDHIGNRETYRERWVSAAEFLNCSVRRYQRAGLLTRMKWHAEDQHN